jgi:hypothetical protein
MLRSANITIYFQIVILNSLLICQDKYISLWVICPNHLGDLPQLPVGFTESFFS